MCIHVCTYAHITKVHVLNSFYRVYLDKYLEVENKETVSEHDSLFISPHLYIYITYTGMPLAPVNAHVHKEFKLHFQFAYTVELT